MFIKTHVFFVHLLVVERIQLDKPISFDFISTYRIRKFLAIQSSSFPEVYAAVMMSYQQEMVKQTAEVRKLWIPRDPCMVYLDTYIYDKL